MAIVHHVRNCTVMIPFSVCFSDLFQADIGFFFSFLLLFFSIEGFRQTALGFREFYDVQAAHRAHFFLFFPFFYYKTQTIERFFFVSYRLIWQQNKGTQGAFGGQEGRQMGVWRDTFQRGKKSCGWEPLSLLECTWER